VLPAVSLVLPCHNEATVLPAVFALLRGWRPRDGGLLEVVLVENGSQDDTLVVCEGFAAEEPSGLIVRVCSLPVGDYGSAVRRGLEESRGVLVAVLDCDMVDTGFVDYAAELFAADADLGAVLASKLLQGSTDTRSLYRRTGSRVFSALVRLVSGSSLRDTHGNKMLRGDVARRFVGRVRENGSLFDTELLLRMVREGWKVGETHTTVTETRPPRSSYVSRVPGTLRGLWRLRRDLRREDRLES
jgi:dolichyl-phosphate beta-glucosyltransferase